jgi:plastocyanin
MPRARASRTTVAALGLAVAAALPAAGCGGDGPPARARDGRVNMTLDDFFLAPQRVRARPGRLTFRVVNRGRLGHTLHVLRGEREVVAMKTLLPGAAAEASGRFERGDYELVCILGNHEELGMRGTLAVR